MSTAQSILDGLQKAMMLRIEQRVTKGGRHRPIYSGADLRAIRAQKGVGRPPMGWARMEKGEWRGVEFVTTAPLYVLSPLQMADITGYAHVLKEHGSQRAAARALGIALSTFQRRLAKERAA